MCLLQHSIIMSQAILDELREILERKSKFTPQQIDEAVDILRLAGNFVEPASVSPDACRGADDLVILGTAASGDAEALVTGDKDILDLIQYNGIPILSPRAFYDQC